MQQDIINKYGKEIVNNFWIFIENLKFDSKKQDALTVRTSILKKISPSMAEKYKDIGDELAFSLYRNVYYDKKNSYLYASFEAISKGHDFYRNLWDTPEKIDPVVESIDQFNNFSTVLPTGDDYFGVYVQTPEEIWDDYEDYDEHLESIGNKKGKKTKPKSDQDND
jgi:hypothetical protein